MPQSLHVVEARGLVLDWQVVRDPEISMLSMLFMGGVSQNGGASWDARIYAIASIWCNMVVSLFGFVQGSFLGEKYHYGFGRCCCG